MNVIIAVIVIITSLILAIRAEYQDKPLVYIIGCIKKVDHLPSQVIDHIHNFTSYSQWNFAKLVIGADDRKVEEVFTSHFSKSNVHFVKDSSARGRRTVRIANCRNQLLKYIHGDSSTLDPSIRDNIWILMLDLDESNTPHMNVSSLNYVVKHSQRWTAVSFNREDYYDIWALRYHRFDVNLWNVSPDINFSIKLTDIIAYDIERELNHSVDPFYQVYSAFNGLALMKFNETMGCEFNGMTTENFVRDPIDCEHVSFFRCMHQKQGGKVMIYKYPLILAVKDDEGRRKADALYKEFIKNKKKFHVQ